MIRLLIIIFISIIASPYSFTQQFTKAIEDNSYFIEEAYNQETGVVQHISNAVYEATPSKNFDYSFTQEWPIFSQEHQLSYTVPYCMYNSTHRGGIGNFSVNYRYQLFYGDDWAAVSPRLSIVLPTATADCDLDLATAGFQVNLPVSKRLSEPFVAHFNAGFGYFPSVNNILASGRSVKNPLKFYNLGGSLIWLVSQKQNLMIEYVENFVSEVGETGEVKLIRETIISPGYRQAIDIGNLQIVPGIALPIVFRGGTADASTFLYLSLEHLL